jgi:AcrR family transcriptional regulator
MKTSRTPGRPRVSNQNKQDQIRKIATKLFSDLGYDKTTIRLIAEKCEVDPKLVMHYFGNKQKLFMATVKVPTEVSAAITLLKLTPSNQWGKRITDVIWLAKESGTFQTLVGLIRASTSEPEVAEMFREFYLENLLLPMVGQLDLSHKELRAVMMSSLVVGYVFNQEIIGLFDQVKVSEKTKKKLFAELVQTVLTREL